MDFPTFGKPINPTSASNFSSKISSFSSTFSPSWANLGTCLVDVAKWELPFPPLPPAKINSFCPCLDKSANTSSVFASFTMVPSGTLIIKSSPLFP